MAAQILTERDWSNLHSKTCGISGDGEEFSCFIYLIVFDINRVATPEPIYTKSKTELQE